MTLRHRGVAPPPYHHPRNTRASATPPEAAVFDDLLAACGGSGAVTLATSNSTAGRGLIATRDLAPGDVALAVPRSACIVVDYTASGLTLPGGGASPDTWPRTRAGVALDDAAPWDDLMALAVLDAAAGAGGEFWGEYAELLPQPLELTPPICLPDDLLDRLGDEALASAARDQRARLAATFSGLASPFTDTARHPTFMEWAFACVRSRAFSLGRASKEKEEALVFAYVPFLDCANHAPGTPTADFGLAGAADVVHLRAVTDIPAGQAVTISYTGPRGMTNARLMAQYGFALPSNPADRLTLDFDAARNTAGVPPTTTIDVDAIMDGLGSAVSADVLRGRAPAVASAIRSLPLGEGGDAGSSSSAALAGALAGQVETQWQGKRAGLWKEQMRRETSNASDIDPTPQHSLPQPCWRPAPTPPSPPPWPPTWRQPWQTVAAIPGPPQSNVTERRGATCCVRRAWCCASWGAGWRQLRELE